MVLIISFCSGSLKMYQNCYRLVERGIIRDVYALHDGPYYTVIQPDDVLNGRQVRPAFYLNANISKGHFSFIPSSLSTQDQPLLGLSNISPLLPVILIQSWLVVFLQSLWYARSGWWFVYSLTLRLLSLSHHNWVHLLHLWSV